MLKGDPERPRPGDCFVVPGPNGVLDQQNQGPKKGEFLTSSSAERGITPGSRSEENG